MTDFVQNVKRSWRRSFWTSL